MNHEELKKWLVVGLGDDFTYVVDPPGYKINVFRAPYGDFIRSYVEHLNMPWWKKRKRWRQVEQKMRDILNQRSFALWFEKRK